MSKNNKGKSIKRRTKGHGVRALRKSLHMGIMGGYSFIYTHEISLHTPPIVVQEKRQGKIVNVMKFVKEDREARKGTLQRMRNLQSGKSMLDIKQKEGESPAEMAQRRDDIKGNIITRMQVEMERPGLSQFRGSNRHDRKREEENGEEHKTD